MARDGTQQRKMIDAIVLGGTGFLGRHVMAELRRRGLAACALSRTEGCDILDFSTFTARLASLRPRVVVNAAAHVGSVHYAMEHAADMIHDNTQILVNIYRAVGQACPDAAIIHPISNCSYPGEIDVQDEPRWQSGPVHSSVLAYGFPRRLIHALADCYYRQFRIRSINWIVANAFGPGDHLDPNKVHAFNGIVIRMILAKRAGSQTFEIWGSGQPIREWVFIKDVARILSDSVERALRESDYVRIQPLNFGQNKGYTIATIAAEIARIMDFPVRIVFNTTYADGAPIKVLDDTRFRKEVPDFTFTPFEEAARETVRYFEEQLPR
jgi:GDP-L-fucose synthase